MIFNLPQLHGELAAARICVDALGQRGDTVHTYDNRGAIIGLPDGSDAVVEAHDPQPIVDPRIAVIEGMDLSDGDKAALIGLIVG